MPHWKFGIGPKLRKRIYTLGFLVVIWGARNFDTLEKKQLKNTVHDVLEDAPRDRSKVCLSPIRVVNYLASVFHFLNGKEAKKRVFKMNNEKWNSEDVHNDWIPTNV